MKLDTVDIQLDAITAETAGEGYAFLGGFVDLKPWAAKTMVVGWNVEVETTDTVEGESDFDRYLAIVSYNSNGKRTIRLSTQITRTEAPSIQELLDFARRYEREELVPPGFTQAFIDWVREQGIEVETLTVTAADAYATQSAYVNNMAHIHRDETFIAEFLSDHRTLQSQVASLWLKTLYAWVEADPDGTFTDERNLPAWRKAKAVTVALGPDGWAVPFV